MPQRARGRLACEMRQEISFSISACLSSDDGNGFQESYSDATCNEVLGTQAQSGRAIVGEEITDLQYSIGGYEGRAIIDVGRRDRRHDLSLV